MAPRHASSSDLRRGWLVDAQGSSDRLRTWTRGIDPRPDAGVEPLSLARPVAVRIISCALEKRPCRKLKRRKLKIRVATRSCSGFVPACAPPSLSLLRRDPTV